MNKKLCYGLLSLTLSFLLFASDAYAAPPKSLISDQLISKARDFLANPVVNISVMAQNKKYKNITEEDVGKLDSQWVKERDSDDQPLIAATLSSPLSNYLTQIQAASGGVIGEMFVMDANGLNVGQSGITSDYWQGDESKFQKTFPVGPKTVFIDDPEFDNKNKVWRVQVSMTIADEEDKPIGAITIEYNLSELARLKS